MGRKSLFETTGLIPYWILAELGLVILGFTPACDEIAAGDDFSTHCWRALNFDHPFALNFDQGWKAGQGTSGCG